MCRVLLPNPDSTDILGETFPVYYRRGPTGTLQILLGPGSLTHFCVNIRHWTLGGKEKDGIRGSYMDLSRDDWSPINRGEECCVDLIETEEKR